MKVLLINHEFPPNGGGAATITRELFERFDNSKHKVALLTANAPKPKINIYTFKNGRKSKSTGSIFEFIKFFIFGLFQLKKINSLEKPDVVFAFFSIPGGILAYVNKWRFNVPYIVSIRGGDIPGFQLGKWQEFLQKLATPVIKLVCKNANYVHVNSQRLKYLTEQIGIPSEKIKYIPNGTKINDNTLIEKQINSHLKLLFTGRLSIQKNLMAFMQALTMVNYNYTFTIIGNGPQRRKIFNFVKKHNLQKKVTFVSWTSRRRLDEYYRNNHVFILPSLDEGMSNSALEAVKHQCALLASENAHLQWQDKDLMDNWVINDYTNPEEWKKSLDYIFANTQEINKTSKKMKQFILDNNDWDKIFNQYMNLVESCVE